MTDYLIQYIFDLTKIEISWPGFPEVLSWKNHLNQLLTEYQKKPTKKQHNEPHLGDVIYKCSYT